MKKYTLRKIELLKEEIAKDKATMAEWHRIEEHNSHPENMPMAQIMSPAVRLQLAVRISSMESRLARLLIKAGESKF